MGRDNPLILVCNDDGILAPGLSALAKTAEAFGQVEVIAPDRQQSAVGHAITVMQPLRVQQMRIEGKVYGKTVNGTPADCVKLAHDKLLDRKPDIILSGINHGSNAGINILYSGTVSAATEGTILGYPSIAISCTDYDTDADLTGPCEAAAVVIGFVLDNGLPPGITLNLNVPSGPLKGIKWTRMADSRYVEEYEGRYDPNNRPYYWITGKFELLDSGEDLDVHVINEGYASLTPIHYDLTAYDSLETLRKQSL